MPHKWDDIHDWLYKYWKEHFYPTSSPEAEYVANFNETIENEKFTDDFKEGYVSAFVSGNRFAWYYDAESVPSVGDFLRRGTTVRAINSDGTSDDRAVEGYSVSKMVAVTQYKNFL